MAKQPEYTEIYIEVPKGHRREKADLCVPAPLEILIGQFKDDVSLVMVQGDIDCSYSGFHTSGQLREFAEQLLELLDETQTANAESSKGR